MPFSAQSLASLQVKLLSWNAASLLFTTGFLAIFCGNIGLENWRHLLIDFFPFIINSWWSSLKAPCHLFSECTSLIPWVSSAGEVLGHQQELSSVFGKVSILFCTKCCVEHLVKENANKKGTVSFDQKLNSTKHALHCVLWNAIHSASGGQWISSLWFHCFGFKSKQD